MRMRGDLYSGPQELQCEERCVGLRRDDRCAVTARGDLYSGENLGGLG